MPNVIFVILINGDIVVLNSLNMSFFSTKTTKLIKNAKRT